MIGDASGGKRAGSHGKSLENFIEKLLQDKGYSPITKGLFDPAKVLEQPIYTRQYNVGNSIYGKPRFCDFMLYHQQRWTDGLVIESKWQQSSGSVDEKFPYLLLSIQAAAYDTIVVLDGGGCSSGAKEWLCSQAGRGRFKNMLDMMQLQKFANDNHL